MRYAILLFLAGIVLACQSSPEEADVNTTDFAVEYEKFTLDNGLQVIFHIDRSDPVVAVALTAHVGSAREVENRTGFAHLFEHLLFLESENLGKGGLDKLSARIGGSGANGSTSRDRTNYFQTVPNDALEKMIWAEADKLGYFINTVTEPVLAKEKQVVKNEKRQGVDNRPYGHVSSVINSNLYPKGHPYSWEVIGSLEDLQNATLQDVKDFFNRWYVPNNVTLTIAGDFDMAQAKEWVHYYFDEIPSGEDIAPQPKQLVELTESKRLSYEDNFARLPQLTKAWPGVYRYHPDAYPLAILVDYLSRGKEAPLYRQVVETDKLADNVNFYQSNAELAGQLMLQVTAFDGVPLDSIDASVKKALAQFELDGIAQEDLDRIKAGQERNFYNGLSSVLGKGFQLAQYEIFAGDPGYITEDVQRILDVTTEDVMRVYAAYIKDQPFVAASFVPKGQESLVLSGSVPAVIAEEAIVQGAEESFDASQEATYERTPSSFDRSVEPPYGRAPSIVPPAVWQAQLPNGIETYGIADNEVPLVRFEIRMEGGKLLDEEDRIGTANLLAQLMTKGTKDRTPAELEKAIALLGSSISAYATDTAIVISVNCLARNFEPTVALVNEILRNPRWDESELSLIQESVKSQLQRQLASPNAIANNEFAKLLYGADHPMARNLLGTTASLDKVKMDDLISYYSQKISPANTRIHLVGAIDQAAAEKALASLDMSWAASEVQLPNIETASSPPEAKVYFYDVPDAKQSVLSFGRQAAKATDEDYYALGVMNYRLGGGGFASQLTQQLREGKGYTYGIRSRFNGDQYSGRFSITSGVRSNVTYESAALVQEILADYANGLTDNDLEVTKSFMLKSSARSFETSQAKLSMIRNISLYGYDRDYPSQRMDYVRDLSLDELRNMAAEQIDPDRMIYLVVGDAATQLDRLKDLGYGEAELLNGEVEDIKD